MAHTDMNKNLDFMRAIAVSLVVFSHTIGMFTYSVQVGPIDIVELGRTGVLIFFVHTCCVLMQSLERDSHVATFYVRRLFRIYPLAVVCISLIMLISLPQCHVESGHFVMWHADTQDKLANILLMQSVSNRVNVLEPSWSLIIEIGMYILLPLIFMFVRTNSKAIGLYSLILMISMSVKHTELIQSNVFLSQFTQYMPTFMGGVITYRLLKTVSPKIPAWAWPVTLVSMCLIHASTHQSDWDRYVFTLSLGVVVPMFKELKSSSFNFTTLQVSKYSYGIYLTHFAAIYLAFDLCGQKSMGIQIPMFIALLIGVPIIAYHLIEQPMINLGKCIVSKERNKHVEMVSVLDGSRSISTGSLVLQEHSS